jgi:hypothetical protein
MFEFEYFGKFEFMLKNALVCEKKITGAHRVTFEEEKKQR